MKPYFIGFSMTLFYLDSPQTPMSSLEFNSVIWDTISVEIILTTHSQKGFMFITKVVSIIMWDLIVIQVIICLRQNLCQYNYNSSLSLIMNTLPSDKLI